MIPKMTTIIEFLIWLFNEKLTSTKEFAECMNYIPNWLIPASAGFSVAFLVLPFRQGSRAIKEWHRITRIFEVIWIQTIHKDDPQALNVSAKIRFLKDIKKAKVTLRVHQSERLDLVIAYPNLEDIRAGQDKEFQILAEPISHPGWIPWHGGWGPDEHYKGHDRAAMGKSIVVLEISGAIITHRLKLMIDLTGVISMTNKNLPMVFVLKENENPFELKK